MNSLDYAVTYAFVHTKSAMQTLARKTHERVQEFRNDESGMEIIAVVLILLVVIALAVIFRKALGDFFSSLWKSINNTLKGSSGGAKVSDPDTGNMNGGF